MAGASEPVDVSTKQQRIAELARQSPEMGFTSLAYFIDIDWLREAYPAYAQGRGGGRGRTEWRGLRGGPGGQPPVAAGTSQVRHVPGASGASGPYPQGRLGDRNSAAGHSDLSFILHLFATGLRIEGWVRPFLGLCRAHEVERRLQERRWALRKRPITSGVNRIHQGP